MLLRRLQNGAIALAGILSPSGTAWALLLVRIAGRQASAPPTKAPNPTRAPWYYLGPQEVLVEIDPWLAGTIMFWLCAGVLILTGFVTAVLCWWPADSIGWKERRLTALLSISLLLGLGFAAPWLYALIWLGGRASHDL